jgi:hypothetical protein
MDEVCISLEFGGRGNAKAVRSMYRLTQRIESIDCLPTVDHEINMKRTVAITVITIVNGRRSTWSYSTVL